MATIGAKYFELVMPDELNAALVFEYPEEASQSAVKKKSPVVFDASSGEIEQATAAQSFWGFALADFSGTTGEMAQVLLATATQVWSGTKNTSGATVVTLVTDVGNIFSWLYSTITDETDKTGVDDATASSFNIIALDPRDVVGDSNGRLLFMIPAAEIAPQSA